MTQDLHQRALERYESAKEAVRKQHERMREDLRFSNPSDPQQWPQEALDARKGRVCLTLDRTNQYIVQIVNEARKGRPGITTMPADSKGDIEVAKRLDGIIRHIEYRSRAAIAYDTAIEHAARCGLGWIRVVPEVVRPETNHQEVTIKRVHDPLSIVLDPDSTEPDGSDARFGFAETMMSKRAFKAAFPKASEASWQGDDASNRWATEDGILVCEYQVVEETKKNHIVIGSPEGDEIDLTEDDYHELSQAIGYQPPVIRTFMGVERSVKWCKLNGNEVLEETTFPAKFIGFVPVVGFELWVDGERDLCGLTRRMMEAQRAYNYERSALVEAVALQPKAPVMTPMEAVAGHEKHWGQLNTGAPAYLPYNHASEDGAPIPPPQRLAPPTFPVAFAQGGQLALADLEGALGMFQSNLGAPNNSSSGKQERERKEQGATATFHFVDNLSRSIEQVGRIVVDMIPNLYDTKRQARILGIDGKNDQVDIDPSGPAIKKQGGKVVSINPAAGSYDVRVVAGTNYTTQRAEAAERIADILQASPMVAPALLPALIKLQDWPEAEKISRMLLAMAPPEVQQIANEGEDGEEPMPPQAQAAIRQLEQQAQQMGQMLDAGEQELQRLTAENEQLKADKSIEAQRLQLDQQGAQIEAQKAQADAAIRAYEAQTERLVAEREPAESEQQAQPQQQEAAAPQTTILAMGGSDSTVEALAASLMQSQEQIQQALEGLAAATMAPRAITLQRDEQGRPQGAVSVPV
jgi:hypothetical protein